MKVVFCFVVLSIGVVVPDMAGECFMARFYLELGCTPVPSDDKGPCPAAFSCPELHPDPTKCYYRGVEYNSRAAIPESQVLSSCSRACNCGVWGGAARIDCATVDCVEFMNTDDKQCVFTYEMDSCCATGTVCGKDALAELKTCEVDGKTYYEGQQFEPSNTGKICICTADWDGKMDNKSCKDINCGLELHYQEEIMNHCAPVFYGDKSICPSGFQCPSTESKTIRGLNIRNDAGECTFGNFTLRVGDEVSVDNKCMECSCKMPPFVSCRRKNDCTN